jgi:hypothetical protein
VTCLGLVALAGAVGIAQDRDDRGNSLRPTLTDRRTSAQLLVSYDGFTELADRPVLVESIWPLAPDAPPPPGVPDWPQPGQVVVSPQVAEDLRASPNPTIFGPIASLIGPDGLETPNERRVYLRPTPAALDQASMQPATGFGDNHTDGWYGLGVLDAAPRWEVAALLLGGVTLPGLVALALGSGLDHQRRTTRHRLLTVIGARRRDLLLLDASEAWPAVTLGTTAAAAAVAAAATVDVHLPALETTILSAQVREHFPVLLAAILLGHLVSILAVLTVISVRGPRRRHGFSTRIAQALPVTRATIGLGVGAATVVLPTFSQSGPLRTLIYIIGTAIFVLTLPAILAVTLAAAGSIAASIALRTGSVGSLLGGRRLEVFPARTARLCLGIAGVVLALGQIQLWASQLGQQYTDAQAARATYGTTVLHANHTSYGAGASAFLHDLPSSARPMWTWLQESPDAPPQVVVGATCSTLKLLDLSCQASTLTAADAAMRAPQLRAIIETSLAYGDIDIQPLPSDDATPLAAHQADLYVVSTDGRDLPLDDLQKLAYQLTPGGLQLEAPGQSWLTQGATVKLQGAWTIAWGSIGVLAVLIAAALAIGADLISSARDIAPLAALAGRRRWLLPLALWRLALPITVAGVGAAVAYLILPMGIESGETFMTPSPTYASFAAIGSLLTAALVALYAALTLQHLSKTWRPGDQDYTAI